MLKQEKKGGSGHLLGGVGERVPPVVDSLDVLFIQENINRLRPEQYQLFCALKDERRR